MTATPDTTTPDTAALGDPTDANVGAHWEELVTVALLGTDRRDPPDVPGPVADVVADAVRSSPAERMLAEVAAVTAIRRAGLLPLAPATPLPGPRPDDRPVCSRRVADRWRHLVASWPVLEDEWIIVLIERGWRLDPDIVAPMMARHRRDPDRWFRTVVAAGALAEWLTQYVPMTALAGSRSGAAPAIGDRDLGLPHLPIPTDLIALCDATGTQVGEVVAEGLVAGRYGPAHRIVLVNLLARVRVDGLSDIVAALESVQSTAVDGALAASLVDLVRTRRAMLDELATAVPDDRSRDGSRGR